MHIEQFVVENLNEHRKGILGRTMPVSHMLSWTKVCYCRSIIIVLQVPLNARSVRSERKKSTKQTHLNAKTIVTSAAFAALRPTSVALRCTLRAFRWIRNQALHYYKLHNVTACSCQLVHVFLHLFFYCSIISVATDHATVNSRHYCD